MKKEDFMNKKVLVLGMARSGYEVSKLLSKYNNEIIITDKKEQDSEHLDTLNKLGVTFVLSDDPIDLIDSSFDLVIKNPGISYNHPLILKAIELGVKVVNEVEVAYHFLPEDVTIIAVTGSNGKTTTTTLCYEFVKQMGLPVHLGGNIGYPVSQIAEDVKPNDVVVLEISGHQLHDCYDFNPTISILTNLTEVHTDFFGTHENYVDHKLKIYKNQTEDNVAIINKVTYEKYKFEDRVKAKKIFFSSYEDADLYLKDDAIYYKDEKIIDTKDIKLKGKHNYENIMCAIAATKQLNISNETIKEVLSNFYGVEHRIEYVKTVNGVEFYNDSKATNVKSTEIALNSFSNPTILILGGLDRHHSFDDLKDDLDHVKYIVCYGETKFRIKDFCDSIDKPCIVVDNLREAVRVAYSKSESGYTVLLSPACASWDQYDNFEIRGSEFKDEVNKLV